MGQAPKPLVQLVVEGRFRPARHAQLLREQPLPMEIPLEGAGDRAQAAWDELRRIAAEYRRASAPSRRRMLAQRFSAAVGELHRALDASDLSMEALLYATIGPGPRETVAGLGAGWDEWDAEHGLTWRVQRGIACATDLYLMEHGREVDLEADPPDPPDFAAVVGLG